MSVARARLSILSGVQNSKCHSKDAECPANMYFGAALDVIRVGGLIQRELDGHFEYRDYQLKSQKNWQYERNSKI